MKDVKNLTYEELVDEYMDTSTELANISALIVKLQQEQTLLGKRFNEVSDQMEVLENLEESKSAIKN